MTHLPRIIRVFSNNAVLASADESEMVLVGRGIGFARSPGDLIDTETIQHRFVELSPDRAWFYNQQRASAMTLKTINAAVELASDLLGELHPSVYLLLADHLVFAVQRHGDGELIKSPLLAEIKAGFPAEFAAAELIVSYLNSHLDVSLPVDEAAFIALHLNAALTGDTVKVPLQQANLLSELVAYLEQMLGLDRGEADDEIITSLMRLAKRVRTGKMRENILASDIIRRLPRESAAAQQVIEKLAGDSVLNNYHGEVAFFAMKLHGWLNRIP